MSSTLDVTFERNFFYTLALHFIDKYEYLRDDDVSREFCLNTFTLLQSENCGYSRIKTLGKFVVNNMFVNDKNTDTILFLYMHVTRYIGLLTRMTSRWKRRQMSVHNDTDLLLLPLSSYSPTIITTIIDKGEKYIFKISDLINLVFSALTNSEDRWYAAPTKIKNPYTGLPFSLGIIYNIFLTIHESSFRMPVLFNIFINTGCDLTVFGMNYECLLREIMIENNIRNLSTPELSNEIRTMLSFTTAYSPLERDDEIIVRIHESFPSDIIISVFKPYLTPYYTHKYSLNPFIRHKSGETLVKKLIVFRKDNPMFGRRLISSNTRFASNRFITTRNHHFNEHVRQNYHDIDIENTTIPFRTRRRNAITYTDESINTNIPPVPRISIPQSISTGISSPSAFSLVSNRENEPASGSGQLSDVIIDALLENSMTNNNLINMASRNFSTSSLQVSSREPVSTISQINEAEIQANNILRAAISRTTNNPRNDRLLDANETEIVDPEIPDLEPVEPEEPATPEPATPEPATPEPAIPEPEETVLLEPEETVLSEPEETVLSEPEETVLLEPEIPALPEPHEMEVNEPEPDSEEKEEVEEQEEKSSEESPPQYELAPSPRRQSIRSALSNYRMNT